SRQASISIRSFFNYTRNIMKILFNHKTALILLAATLAPLLGFAQDKATLGILDIKPTPALVQSLQSDNKIELDRINESLDGQLIDRFNSTRKFDIVSRSDLKEVMKEQ